MRIKDKIELKMVRGAEEPYSLHTNDLFGWDTMLCRFKYLTIALMILKRSLNSGTYGFVPENTEIGRLYEPTQIKIIIMGNEYDYATVMDPTVLNRIVGENFGTFFPTEARLGTED